MILGTVVCYVLSVTNEVVPINDCVITRLINVNAVFFIVLDIVALDRVIERESPPKVTTSLFEVFQEDEGDSKRVFVHFFLYFSLFFLKYCFSILQACKSYYTSVCKGNSSFALYLTHFNPERDGRSNVDLTLH